MVRKLAMAVALALGSASMTTYGLGLGEIDTHSALNQNFDAEIELLSVDADGIEQIRVQLAPAEAFTQAGIDRPYYLSQLRFTPEGKAGGRNVVRITTDFPVREPFLNFLVEMNWPNGRVLREYTVLLDPPTTTQRRAPRVAQATASTQTQATAPVRLEPAANEYGPVQANDTLWGIASEVRPSGVSMAQMMMALLKANPHAFVDNNVNRLQRGQILRVPDRAEILALSREEAQAMYQAQQDDWMTARAPTPATEPAEAAVATADQVVEPEPQGDRLRIAAALPDTEGEAAAVDTNLEGAATADDLSTQVLLAKENAETSRLEAEQLRERVETLRSQLDDMQRLLSLKDDQLAKLQRQAAGEVVEPAAEDAAATVPAMSGEAPATPEVSGGETAELEPPAEVVLEGMDTAGETEAVPPDTADIVVPPEGEGVAIEPEAGMGTPVTAEAPAAAPTEAELPAADTPKPPEMATAEAPAPEAESELAVGSEPIPEPQAEPVKETGGFGELPLVAGGVAGIAVLGALLGLAVARRTRKQGKSEPADSFEDLVERGNQVPAAKGAAAAAAADAAAPSHDLPEAFDTLGDDTADVDPVSEADVYIAYGRYQQAEQLLLQAMDKDPNRVALPHKLLEVYYATRKTDDFVALAGEMMADGRDQAAPDAWERAKEMGRELVPDNPMFSLVPGAAPATAPEGVGLEDLESSELATEIQGDETSGSAARGAGKAPAPEDADTTFDLDSLSRELEEQAVDEDSLAMDNLDTFDLELSKELGDDMSGGTGTAGSGASDVDMGLGDESVLKVDTDLDMSELDELSEMTTLDAELAGYGDADQEAASLGLESAFETGDEAGSEAMDLEIGESAGVDDVDTKLDLARAYMDMGDAEGARSILAEVEDEGNDSQRDQARQLLADLAEAS